MAPCKPKFCSCPHFLVGDFVNLVDEKGTFFSALNGRDDFNSDSESNVR